MTGNLAIWAWRVAVYFFASDLSQKSTGNVLNVDAGHLAAFTR